MFTHYEYMENDTKYQKCGGSYGPLKVTGNTEIAPFDRVHTSCH